MQVLLAVVELINPNKDFFFIHFVWSRRPDSAKGTELRMRTRTLLLEAAEAVFLLTSLL